MTDYDPEGIDRLMAAVIASAIEDASGNIKAVGLKKYDDPEYYRRRHAINALDWLATNGPKWLEHVGFDPYRLAPWMEKQERRIFGGEQRQALAVQSTANPAPGQPHDEWTGRPLPGGARSVRTGRSHSPGGNGKVHSHTIPGDH